jgi:hypothetical protein
MKKRGLLISSDPQEMRDFQRAKAGVFHLILPLKDLPCLIAPELPTEVKVQGNEGTE